MKCGATTTLGPKGTETLKVSPGETVEAGYDFMLPGNKKTFTISFAEAKVVLNVRCVSKAKPAEPTFTVSLSPQSYTATNDKWVPTDNQKSPLVYQGATTAPNLCGGGQLEVKESAFSAFMTIQ